MNELINRQPKLCPFCGGIAIVDMDEDWYWEWKALCPKCGCDLGYFKTKEEAIKAWNKRVEPPADQWIPCSERLPKIGQICIVTRANWFGKPKIEIAGYWLDGWKIKGQNAEILAWMPRPEPYKGVE